MTYSEYNLLSSAHQIQKIDEISHSGKIWETSALSCYFWPLLPILVHFCALHGQPHSLSGLNYHQVINDMYPTHQKLLNPTSPTFLAHFVTEPLIKHGLFPWIKVDKSHHHQPYRLGVRVVTLWCRSWLIIINLCKYSLEHTAMKILSKCHDILMSFHFEPPLMRIHLKTYQNNGFLNR